MALKNLFNEVEFLAQYPMVGLAVSNSSGPVPGYLFGEINAVTYVDNGHNCKALVNFLISRLQSDTPIVCIKVLKLLLYLVTNGHSQIIDDVKLHEVALKEARRFSGLADDVYGNSFYQTIRKMSKELLDVIYSENKEKTEEVSYADQISFTGLGSEASSKKMPGFGYSVKTEKTISDVVSDSFSSFVEKLFPSPEEETESMHMSHLGDALPKYKPLIIDKSQSAIDETSAAEDSSVRNLSTPIPKVQRKVKAHRPGRAGGGWESSSDEENSNSSPIPPVEPVSKESSISADSLENSKLCVPSTSEECKVSDECRVVNEFTLNEPLCNLNYSEVSSICKRCSSLNCDEILSLALKKLSETEEFVQLRALVFIEYLLFLDIITVEPLLKIVLPHLKKFLEEEQNVKPSIKLKATKICLSIEILNKKTEHELPSVEQIKCSS